MHRRTKMKFVPFPGYQCHCLTFSKDNLCLLSFNRGNENYSLTTGKVINFDTVISIKIKHQKFKFKINFILKVVISKSILNRLILRD